MDMSYLHLPLVSILYVVLFAVIGIAANKGVRK